MLVGEILPRAGYEARERAARASNPSIRDNFEAAAKEWSTLAVWAELRATPIFNAEPKWPSSTLAARGDFSLHPTPNRSVEQRLWAWARTAIHLPVRRRCDMTSQRISASASP